MSGWEFPHRSLVGEPTKDATFFQSKDSLPPDLLARWGHAVAEHDLLVLNELCGDSEARRMFFYTP